MSIVLRTLLLVGALAPVLLAGCGQPSAEERLVGKWQGQVELNEEEVKKELAKTGDDSSARLVFDALKSMEVEIEFKPGGAMQMAASAKTPEGTDTQTVSGAWEVVAAEGDQVTIQSRYEGEEKPEKIDLEFQGADAFSTRPPGPNARIGVLRMKRLH